MMNQGLEMIVTNAFYAVAPKKTTAADVRSVTQALASLTGPTEHSITATITIHGPEDLTAKEINGVVKRILNFCNR